MKRAAKILLISGVLMVALLVYGAENRTHANATKRVLACPAARALLEVVDAAGELSKWRMAKAALVNQCVIVDRGESVAILENGGFLWWRTKIVKDGKHYWMPSDAL